ncbi:hypothetical protein BT93_L5922 [Corymbia citriodora subsp. variegata]|uniref:Uncharacterized protein n=1 Tax=Corymbia citriodora subsp. variegata TaxID=360336 RepID=A0A8T0CVK7_CORYI|nr:hypothetical protein BT93_L5922 [Corymbia citriodora subsp. variegata]
MGESVFGPAMMFSPEMVSCCIDTILTMVGAISNYLRRLGIRAMIQNE